ncbi:hypothetical protein K1719_002920 [Acacia pycnantha]|nr:hypothetical protein K1719_002920 [Acacia pycnantha]
MESNSLSSFFTILRESLGIFLKNKRLMPSIALLILLLRSFLLLCNYFSVEPLTQDFIMKQTQLLLAGPGSPRATDTAAAMTSYFREFVGLEWFFILALSMASLFSSAITILASAVTYAGANLSYRDLLSRVFKSCKRPIITWFYISLFDFGYVFLVCSLIFPFSLKFSPFPIFHPTTFVYVLLIPVSAFQMYLSVFWKMSLVISVLEEKSGLEAFGKAWQILEGFKLQGFLLNLLYGAPVLILNILWFMKISANLGTYNNPLLMGLILLTVGCVSKMLVDMWFTVLYHKCKLRHEGEVELHGSLEYTKVVSNETMIGADIP